MAEPKDQSPYMQGHLSYLKNKGRYSNPYPAGDGRHNEFERGWSQRLKTASTDQAKEFARYWEIEDEFLAKEEEQRKAAAIRAYRNRKG